MLSIGKDAGLLVLTALLTLLMFGMGVWQLSRAEEKRQLLLEWQQRSDSDLSLAQAIALSAPFGYRLTANGPYQAGSALWLDNQVEAGQVGYRLIRALHTAHGLLAVDTGWWPANPDRRQLPAMTSLSEPVQISGHLVRAYRPPIALGQFVFTPAHPVVPSLVPELLAEIWGQPVLPFVLKLGVKEAHWQPVVMGPERHTAYAVQWFAMTLAVWVAAIWHYRRRHET